MMSPSSPSTIILFARWLLVLSALRSRLWNSRSNSSDLHSNLCRTRFLSLGIDSSSELSGSYTLSSGDMYSMVRTSCSFLFFSAMYEFCMRASLRALSFYEKWWMAYYGITSLKVHNNLKCSNTSKHCQWSGIKPTEHTCIWSMKTINILVNM